MFRRVLFFVALPVVLLGILFASLQYFQNYYFKSKLLPQLIQQVESQSSIKFSHRSVELSIFKGLRILDSRVVMEDLNTSLDLKIPELRVRYSLWSLFSKQFRISELALIQPSLEGRIQLQKPTQSRAGPLWPEIKKSLAALETLPVSIQIDSIRMDALGAKMELIQAEQKADLVLESIDFLSELRMDRDRLDLSVELDLSESGFALLVPIEKRVLKAQIQGSSDLRLALRKQKQWELALSDLRAGLQLRLLMDDQEVSVQRLKIEERLRERRVLQAEISGSIKPISAGLEAFGLEIPKELDPSLELKTQVDLETQDLSSLAKNWLETGRFPVITYRGQLQAPEMQLKSLKMGESVLISSGEIDLSAPQTRLSQVFEWRLHSLSSLGMYPLVDQVFARGWDLRWDLEVTGADIQVKHFSFFNQDKEFKIESTALVLDRADHLSLRGVVDWRTPKKEGSYLKLPFSIVRSQKNRFRLEADIQCRQLSLHLKDFELGDLFCSVPVRVDFLWDARKAFRFTQIESRNPFERVDYLSIRPFTENQNSNLRFRHLRYKNLKVGPLYADVRIRQNLLLAEQYQLQALDGRVSGLLFLDLWPERPRFGYLGRVSAVNPALLNRTKSASRDSRISSRVALIYDFKKSLLEGRLDVTEIGSSQLLELIRFVDPKKRDEKLNLARSLLRLGYPSYLGLEMAQGFLDLRLDLGGIVSVKNIGVDGIPLTPILRMAEESFFEKMSNQTD